MGLIYTIIQWVQWADTYRDDVYRVDIYRDEVFFGLEADIYIGLSEEEQAKKHIADLRAFSATEV